MKALVGPKHPNHTQFGPKRPINSPLAEVETQEAAQSKNTTRVNIVCPLSAARWRKTGTKTGVSG